MKKRSIFIIVAFMLLGIGIGINDAKAYDEIQEMEEMEPGGVVCQCKPFWHNTCKSRAGGQTCAIGEDCSVGNGNC